MSDDLRGWANVNTGSFHFAGGDGGDPEQLSRDRLRRMSDTELWQELVRLGSMILGLWRAGLCDDPCDLNRVRMVVKDMPELAARLSERELHDLGIV